MRGICTAMAEPWEQIQGAGVDGEHGLTPITWGKGSRGHHLPRTCC